MADPIKADCHTDYKATRHSGTRPVSAITWIVMHSTEVDATAKEIAESFARPAAEGSTHLVVDDPSCYRCLTNDQVPWAAPGANTNGFHIEQCGFAKWTAAQWMAHKPMLSRGAFKVAYHCHLFNIPPVFVVSHDLGGGKKGVTTHAEVSKAFPNDQGNHHDPGTGWPRSYFMGLVSTYYNQLAKGST